MKYNPNTVSANQLSHDEVMEPLQTRRTVTRTVASLLLVGGLGVSLAGCSASGESKAHSDAELTAARTVSLRYACGIMGVQDKRQQPSKQLTISDASRRTSVAVGFKSSMKESAIPTVEQYASKDSGLKWSTVTPKIYLDTESSSSSLEKAPGYHPFMKRDKNIGFADTGSTTSHPGEARTISVDYYPMNTYKEGTTATAYLVGEVTTADDDNLYITDGYQPCGSLVYQEGGWKINHNPSSASARVEVTTQSFGQ